MKSRFLPLLLYLEVHLRCKRSKNNEGFELTCLARTGRRSIYLCRDKKADSLTLTVPQEVTGLLRKSVTIPCTYSPSALHFEVEVIWSFNTHSTIIRRDKAALPSTRSPTSLSPVVIPTSGFNDVKIPIWAFVLTVLLIVLFFSVIIICIVLRTRIKTGHIYESPSVRYVCFPHQAPVNMVLYESDEYEVMTKESEYSEMSPRPACAFGQPEASV
uniref:uncharacterized protein isoform X7 n=1 Tax=Pristiophorus japonicus TaxID=55135 RepID=UPI00398F5E4C